MHEMSLCEGILRIIAKQAEREKFTRVVKVSVAVGERAGASTESLLFCFPLAARGTVAEGAELECISRPDAELKVVELEVV